MLSHSNRDAVWGIDNSVPKILQSVVNKLLMPQGSLYTCVQEL